MLKFLKQCKALQDLCAFVALIQRMDMNAPEIICLCVTVGSTKTGKVEQSAPSSHVKGATNHMPLLSHCR